MLLGLDLKDIPIVIIFSPFSSLNSFIQAGGRAGRRCENGGRKKSIVYALFNQNEIRENLQHMHKNVRDFYKMNTCLKKYVNTFFSVKDSPQLVDTWCCSVCSL